MGHAEISLILTSLTALAAVIGPIVSSVINVRSSERTKRYELYSPKVYASVQKLADAFSEFPRCTEFKKASELARISLNERYTDAYKSFASATYEIMSLLPNQDVHELGIEILDDLAGKAWITNEHDEKFHRLTEALAIALVSEASSKKQRITRKSKRSNSK